MLARVCLTLIAFTFLVQIYLLKMPLHAPNSWREAQTFSVSRNMAEEKFDLLHPRYDWRGTTDGQRGGEFPIYNAFSALAFEVGGISYQSARATTLLITILSLIFVYLIAVRLTGSRSGGLIALTLFQTNSILAALSISIQPEATVQFFALAAVVSFFFVQNEALKVFVIVGFIALAALCKPSGYGVAAFFLVIYFLDWLKTKKHALWIARSFLVGFIPLVLTLKWARFTMQSDTILYPEIYPDLFWLTHLYQRSFSNFLAELSFSPVFHAVKKSLFHSFNIAGVLALVIVVVRKRAAHEKGETRSEEYGLWAWVFCSFAFLIYAGSIQQEQNHYAAPMAIPAIFITAQLLSKFKLPWTVCLLLLQASAGFFYLSKYYIKNPSDWDQYSVESVVNQFSTRKDLFIDFNVEKIYDPTGLGQIQRRGMIYATIEDVEKYKNPYPYLFTRIDQNRSEQVSKLEALKKQYGEPFQSYHHFYFFKLKH